MHHNNSRNSSSVSPLCFRMSASVALASTACIVTTVLNTISAERFSEETWLPFCRRSTNPAETLGSFGTSIGNFDGCPQIQFDGLAQIPASTFDIVALRSDTQFWTAGELKVFCFGDQHRESVSHMAILALPA